MERYTIKGLPDTISERIVLQSLIWYSSAVFFEHKGSLLALPGVPSGDGWNANGDPGSCWVFSRNGIFNEEVKTYLPGSDESAFLALTNAGRSGGQITGVCVWENPMRYPFINSILYFSEQMADTLRTIETSRMNLKNPFVFVCEESLVPTVRKFFEDRDANLAAIISSGAFPVDKVKFLPIDTNAETLQSSIELYEWYGNQFRELCGIQSNSQIDKKGENLISDELHVNDMFEAMQIEKCLDEINRGLDYVNKFFGTHMEAVKKHETEIKNISGDEDGKAGPVSGDDSGGASSDDK